MITFIVLLALLLAIPWTSYAGHGGSSGSSVLMRGCLRYTQSFAAGCVNVVPETVLPNR
ncbi:MAG: hypothetical protein ACM3KE_12700 [Hyphomicrobiales bacterium]